MATNQPKTSSGGPRVTNDVKPSQIQTQGGKPDSGKKK